ncbi:hypothetical protein H4R35_002221 [Dimargaris xerosporica]|nr:hypothetical protein H4R35_002221 [Dimargaris xerosporica]
MPQPLRRAATTSTAGAGGTRPASPTSMYRTLDDDIPTWAEYRRMLAQIYAAMDAQPVQTPPARHQTRPRSFYAPASAEPRPSARRVSYHTQTLSSMLSRTAPGSPAPHSATVNPYTDPIAAQERPLLRPWVLSAPGSIAPGAAQVSDTEGNPNALPLQPSLSSTPAFAIDRAASHSVEAARPTHTPGSDHHPSLTRSSIAHPPPLSPDQYSPLSLPASLAAWTERLLAVVPRPALPLSLRGLRTKLGSKPVKNVLKSSSAFLLATLFTLHPRLRAFVGTSPHLVANATLFFNPVRSKGAFIEAGCMGLLGLCYSATVSYVGLLLATYLAADEEWVTMSKWISLLMFCFVPLFALTYVKANLGRPAVYTGNSISQIMLLVVLTRETNIVHIRGAIDPQSTEDIFTALCTGLLISIVIGWFVWPQRAHDQLKANIDATFESFRLVTDMVVDTFVMDGWSAEVLPELPQAKSQATATGNGMRLYLHSPTTDAVKRHRNLPIVLQAHRQSFAALEKALDEARLEVSEYPLWRHRAHYVQIVRSLNRLSQHLGGIYGGVDLQQKWMEAALDSPTGNECQVAAMRRSENSAPAPNSSRMQSQHRTKAPSEASEAAGPVTQLSVRHHNELLALVEFVSLVQDSLRDLNHQCQATFSVLQRIIDASFQRRLPENPLWERLAQEWSEPLASSQRSDYFAAVRSNHLPSRPTSRWNQLASWFTRQRTHSGEAQRLHHASTVTTNYGTTGPSSDSNGVCKFCDRCTRCQGLCLRCDPNLMDPFAPPCPYVILEQVRLRLVTSLEAFSEAFNGAIDKLYHHRSLQQVWHIQYLHHHSPQDATSGANATPPEPTHIASASPLPVVNPAATLDQHARATSGRPHHSSALADVTELSLDLASSPSSFTSLWVRSPITGMHRPSIQSLLQCEDEISVPQSTSASPNNHSTRRASVDSSTSPSNSSDASSFSSTGVPHGSDSHPYEHLFQSYFFVFSTQEFAAEILTLIYKIELLCHEHFAPHGTHAVDQHNAGQPLHRCHCFALTNQPSTMHESTQTPLHAFSVTPSVSVRDASLGATETASVPARVSRVSCWPDAMIHSPGALWRLIRSISRAPKKLVSMTKSFFVWLFGPPSSQLELYLPPSQLSPPGLHRPCLHTCQQRFRHRLWRFFLWFRWYQTKYALKASITATLLALPAFVEAWYPTFRKFRGEWAAITALVVMVPTVGGSTSVSMYRVLGTIMGGAAAFVVYVVCHGLRQLALTDAGLPAGLGWLHWILDDKLLSFPLIYPLAIFLVTLPGFHVLLNTGYPKVGQFSLITFSVVLLNKMQGGEDSDVDIADIAVDRTVAVVAGVLIGLLVNVCIWPYEARTEIRSQLSALFIHMSVLYDKLVSVFSGRIEGALDQPPMTQLTTPKGAQASAATLARRSLPSSQTFYAMVSQPLLPQLRSLFDTELALQKSVLELNGLLKLTPHEPRLKGPYPTHVYRQVLASCQTILDKLVAVRCAAAKHLWQLRSSQPPSNDRTAAHSTDSISNLSPASQFAQAFLRPCQRERANLVGCTLLYFYILASALLLKTPLPPFLPPIGQAHKKLVDKVRRLEQWQRYQRQRSDPDGLVQSTHDAMRGHRESLRPAKPAPDHMYYMFYYAQVELFADIVHELESLGQCMVELFGCYGGNELRRLQQRDSMGLEQP